MIRSSFIFVFFILCFGISAQSISFIKEKINFKISNDSFIVSGEYIFQNKSNKIVRQFVSYPIYNSSKQLPYFNVLAYNTKNNKELFITKFQNYIVVPVEIKPKRKKSITINYSQKILDSTAVYILTSTKSWNAPLKKVKYIIESDKDINLHISLKAYRTIKKKKRKIYIIKKQNFMPLENLIVSYKNNL